eukprot:3379027-Rhodomonas_salina.1
MVMRRPVARADSSRFGTKAQSSGFITPNVSQFLDDSKSYQNSRPVHSASSTRSEQLAQKKPAPLTRAMSSSHVALEKMIYGNTNGETRTRGSSLSMSRYSTAPNTRPPSGRESSIKASLSPPEVAASRGGASASSSFKPDTVVGRADTTAGKGTLGSLLTYAICDARC